MLSKLLYVSSQCLFQSINSLQISRNLPTYYALILYLSWGIILSSAAISLFGTCWYVRPYTLSTLLLYINI